MMYLLLFWCMCLAGWLSEPTVYLRRSFLIEDTRPSTYFLVSVVDLFAFSPNAVSTSVCGWLIRLQSHLRIYICLV